MIDTRKKIKQIPQLHETRNEELDMIADCTKKNKFKLLNK